MIVNIKRLILWVSGLLSLAALQSLAQPYPSKPIRVIVGVPPGSGVVIVMRAAGQELATRMGQPWLVENRPGGNTVIAAQACARAAPDGYTVCYVSADSMSFNPHVISNLPYDPDKDFKPITSLFYLIQGIIASASLQANSIKELQAQAGANSAILNFATLGAGTNTDIFRQWLNERWKTNIAGIPYKGGNLIVTALVAGEVHFSMPGLGNMGGQLKSGKVKVLAVHSSKRLRLLPDVPTLTEAGLDGFPVKGWFGLAVPAGTPDAIVSRLNSEFVRLFREPKFVEYLEDQYLEPFVGTPEECAAFMKADRELTGVVVKHFNVPRQ
jgi:tripartite-type tricarboxylate transporter receptor subunit TctC